MTATRGGEHLICAQVNTALPANTVVKLSVEVFLGEEGDPIITSPVEAKLNDLSYNIGRSNKLLNDIEREQSLHRDNEAEFRKRTEGLHTTAIRWPIVQALVLIGTAVWQMNHLKKFFKAKKLV